jgi:hypothetical protein
MKATLESRKSVRLGWLKLDKVTFNILRTADWNYNLGSVEQDHSTISVYMQYAFLNISQAVPKTNIIIFEQDLPQSYTKTEGSIGDKFLTEKAFDTDITITDRIVKVEQGEEKITTKPVLPHETQLYKEIQIHERTDKVYRKITFKNETAQAISNIEATFIENKEIRFLSSNPDPSKTDAPEYKWNLTIPADASISIELVLETYTKNTYKIEREKPKPTYSQPSMPPQMANQMDMNNFDEPPLK